MCEAENAPDQVFNTVDSFENKVIVTVDNAVFFLNQIKRKYYNENIILLNNDRLET